MMRLITISTVLATALLTSSVLAAPIKVVASFSVLGDLVQQVGGPNVDVVTLVGPNGDAHTFEPTPADAKNVKSAKLVVTNGLGLDPWFQRLAKSTGYKGAVTTATAGIKPRTGFEEMEEGGDHGHSGIDPHAWQNVANVRVYVKNIVDGLSKVDPSYAADYRSKGDAYAHRLDQLDQEVRAAFAKIPRSERKIITSHDAFGYYGDAYGLTLLAPEGLSTEAEPSAKAVAALIDQIRREHIKAIFVENITDPRLIERIAQESKAKVGGELYSDALSPADGPAATYIDMVRHNTRLIVAALAGQS